jgi:hypothetical protein
VQPEYINVYILLNKARERDKIKYFENLSRKQISRKQQNQILIDFIIGVILVNLVVVIVSIYLQILTNFDDFCKLSPNSIYIWAEFDLFSLEPNKPRKPLDKPQKPQINPR